MFPVFLGVSEILNPVFLWGIRNSECFPVFLGVSEILNPVFLGGSEILNRLIAVFLGGSEILNPLLCL